MYIPALQVTPYNTRPNPVNFAQDSHLQSHGYYPAVQEIKAEHYKEVGNEMLRLHLYPQAIQAYTQSIQANPRYTDAYYNLAQAYKTLEQIPHAIGTMTQLLFINPNDHDARVTLGEYYEKLGLPEMSKRLYMQVLRSKPSFDPAKRNLSYLVHVDQAKLSPETAIELHRTTEKGVIFKARALLKNYYTQINPDEELAKLSQSIPIVFQGTQTTGNTENIAEYDHPQRAIRLQTRMIFSSPNVVAAYLAHELVHAKDNDSETSIMEEQEGYRELARFWQRHKNTEEESNLDRALTLYADSPDHLDKEVRNLYTMRNPLIAESSPGHGKPQKCPSVSVHEQQLAAQKRADAFNRERLKRWLGFYDNRL